MHVEYHIVQDLWSPTSAIRRSYYIGLTSPFSTPTVFFNGGGREIGGRNPYNRYLPRVEAELADLSPLAVEVSATAAKASDAPGRVTVDLAVAEGETVPDADWKVRVLVLERHVPYVSRTWDRVARTLLEETSLAIAASGETQRVSVDLPFDVGAANPANLEVIAFVQRDSDGLILNAAPAAVQNAVSLESQSWSRVKALYRQ